jgi:hypothetical protein
MLISHFHSLQVHLALCAELVSMMENDLSHVLPSESDVRVCELAVRELSHFAVRIVDRMEQLEASSRWVSSCLRMCLISYFLDSILCFV